MTRQPKTPRPRRTVSPLTLMRRADSAASSKTNIMGTTKVRGPKQKPVTVAALVAPQSVDIESDDDGDDDGECDQRHIASVHVNNHHGDAASV